MSKTIHVLYGVGEVGSALKKILIKKSELYWCDINPRIKNNLPVTLQKADVLHITFPQEKNFIKEVQKLIKKFSPELTVIHSTTVPGTTIQLGDKTVHSPIVGQHDNLYKHIKTFRKAIGPNSKISGKLAKQYLDPFFELEFYADSQSTEAAKILSLAAFAVNIEMARYADELCKSLNIDFAKSYAKFLDLYNRGYEKNKLKKFLQPALTPPQDKIGGSCVIPGIKKTQVILKSEMLNAILKQNK